MTTVLKKANTEQHYTVTQASLPLSCPTDEMRVWDSHPKVFLPLGKEIEGELVTQTDCPYCGATYSLAD
jgi:uncharacterized Zn-finger protein